MALWVISDIAPSDSTSRAALATVLERIEPAHVLVEAPVARDAATRQLLDNAGYVERSDWPGSPLRLFALREGSGRSM